MGNAIGIDFGLHNCSMAILKGEQPSTIQNINGSRLTPAVVGIGEDGERLVGEEAKRQAVIYPKDTVFEIRRYVGRDFRDPEVQRDLKRIPFKITEAKNGEVEVWLGDKSYSPIQISAFILEVLKQEIEEQMGQVSHAVITVPAYFNQRQRDAVRTAGQLAGLEVMRLISEPVASALAYGFNPQSGDSKTLLVYDLGGSNFDATILRMADGNFVTLAQTGDDTLGGDNFEQEIINHIIGHTQDTHKVNLRNNREALQKLKQAAETGKITLSGRRGTARISIPAIAQDKRGEWVNVQLSLTRQEYEDMILPYIKRTIDLVHQTIREADSLVEDIDHILLVGGSTLTPLVVESLRAEFGEDKILRGVNPMECVALGAAIAVDNPSLGEAKAAAPAKQKTKSERQPSATKYHGPIPLPVAQLMATCFVRTGRLGEAERLLQDAKVSQDGSSLRYELGMAYAEQGQFDEALGQFRTLLKERPDEAQTRQAAVDVLRVKAGQCANQEDWDGAASTLNEALKLNPKDEQLQQYLNAVHEALPLRYLARGERENAAKLWEEVQKAAPTNYRVAHQLAILHHRWAIDLEQEGQTRAADQHWPKAIANWVLLIEADTFWKNWIARREAVYGQPIPPADLAALRKKELREQLEEIHRGFQTQNDKRADKHKEYRLLLQMEFKTAKALRETADLLQQRGEAVAVPVYAGPLMLEQLGLREAAEKMALLAKRLDPKAEAAQTLATYLSPLGRLHLLIEEHQADQAVHELKRIVEQEPRNSEARRLLVLAFKEAGNLLVSSDVKKAVAAWAEGLAHEPGNTELKELIAKHCIEQASKLQKSDADGAIELLNLGLKHAPDHQGLKEKLAASLNHRGIQYTRQGKWDKAITDLEQALSYDPRNRRFQQDLAAAYNGKGAQLANKAIELMQGGRVTEAERLLSEAITLLERAVQHAPDNASFNQNLVNTRAAKQRLISPPPGGRAVAPQRPDLSLQRIAAELNTKGVQLANDAIRQATRGQIAQADRQLIQAIALLEKAVEYAPHEASFRQDLADTREALKRVRASSAGRRAKPTGPEVMIDALLQVMLADPVACNELGLELVNEAAQLAERNDRAACNKLDEAENVFEMGLQYNPNDPTLKNNLIQVRNLKRVMRC